MALFENLCYIQINNSAPVKTPKQTKTKLCGFSLIFLREIIKLAEFPSQSFLGAAQFCLPNNFVIHVILILALIIMSKIEDFIEDVEHHHRGGGPSAPPCGKSHLQLDQACLQGLC